MNSELSDMHVSVIVPSYNREMTIKRCIDSINNQTIPVFEIIVVDDGSTDKTVEVLENLEYGNLRVIKQNHRGAQAARNLGIINAIGDYIAFLDSDDEWLPQMLEVSLKALNMHDNCVTYSNGYKCYNNKKRLLKIPECRGDAYSFMLHIGGPMFQSMVLRRELLLQIGLLDEKVMVYQEHDTAIQLALAKAEFVYIKKPLFIWHCHDGERISGNIDRSIKGLLYIVDKNKEQSINKFGLKDLNHQYIRILKKCVKKRNKLMFLVLQKMLLINLKTICFHATTVSISQKME